jgi:signal transduction histidine kinase
MKDIRLRNSRGRTAFFVQVWAVWTAVAIISYLRHNFEATNPFGLPRGSWLDLVSWFACFYPWAILTPAIFWLEERFPLTKSDWKGRLGILVLASFLFSYVGLQISVAMGMGVNFAFGRPVSRAGFPWHVSRVEFYFEQFFFWCTWGAGWALRTFGLFHRQAQQATQLALEKAELEASLRRAELENLRMRLNPHFLFNTLQNISVLTQQNPKVATQMLTRLGDLLRVALRRDVPAETTVKEEIALTKDYLAVEKMRLGDRLTILVDIAPGTERALLPSFLLQPLVENAVIHGLRGASQVGTIAMQSRNEGERLILTVADNGRGIPENWQGELKVGVGLSSTQDRLARMYPGEQAFLIHRLAEGGTEVRIAIPFRLKDGPEETVLSEQTSTVGGG